MSYRRMPTWSTGFVRLLGILPLVLVAALISVPRANATRPYQDTPATYTNPLPISTEIGTGRVESCADPAIIHGGHTGDNHWYVFCTKDPLNDEDRNEEGNFIFRVIPILRSADLVNWVYVGDVFPANPAWTTPDAGIFAPEIKFMNGLYHLYYTATNTTLEGGGSAIGVATSDSPAGPWTDAGAPVVEPHRAPCCPESRRDVFDPEVITDETGQHYIYYGSYFGGISARRLSPDGLTSDPATQVQVIVDNKYEAPVVLYHNNYYYMFVSATDCCRGMLTGYSVFVGRATTPLGPFVDREDVSLCEPDTTGTPQERSCLIGRAGGTPVLSMNGNRWVGPGHNDVFQDAAGAYWTIYHAIDRNDPVYAGAPTFTKRPLLLDPLDFVDGWPTVRAGRWASDEPMPAPAAQPGDENRYVPSIPAPDRLGMLLEAYSDEFNGAAPGPQWTWVREPDTTSVMTGTLVFPTQDADLYVDNNSASVLTAPTPPFDYAVETSVRLNLPPQGCCFNYVQAGLVIYGNDDEFIKLVHFSNFNTRQTEFAKEIAESPAPGTPGWRYGNTVVGPPDLTTYLRVVKRTIGAEEHYTAYTSRDGMVWVRGGTWTHMLGDAARIGLVSMGGSGFEARFDYVRVYRLAPTAEHPVRVYVPMVMVTHADEQMPE
jgi:arabinan endo-1,5-alpha-L-arabinosidase